MKSSAPLPSPPEWTWRRFPRRYLMIILVFFGFLHVQFQRINMSIAIIAMTSNQSHTDTDGTVTYAKEFDWDSKERAMVLSAFFYGYFTTQMLGGLLAPMVGAGRLFGLSICLNGLLMLFVPMAADSSIWVIVAIRAVQGAVQGVVFPALQDLFSYWVPPTERTRMVTAAFSGNPIGTFTTMLTSGLLAQHWGWRSIFYIYGCSSLVWTAIWFGVFSNLRSDRLCCSWFFGFTEDPSEDRRTSNEEAEYLAMSIGPMKRVKFFEAPWRRILASKPFWALLVEHFAFATGLFTFITQIPTFVNDVTGWKLGKTGLVSAIPYLVMAVTICVYGYLSDLMRTRFGIRTTIVRKIFGCSCCLIQLVFLLVASHTYEYTNTVIACITVAVAAIGLSTHSVNYLDLAPQYASLLNGVGQTFSTLSGVIFPTLTGFIVVNGEPSEWQTLFYIMCGVFAVGSVVYGIFASGERQPWSYSRDRPPVSVPDTLQGKP